MASICKRDFEDNKIKEHDLNLDSFVNFMTSIESSKITILMKEREDNEIRISLRSDYFLDKNSAWDVINVSEIAKTFGGGGHRSASGCSIHRPLLDAEKLMLDACIEAISKNNQLKKDLP